MITAQGLTRRFGSFLAVDDVDFHLERGEVVGFLGLNGAGKTTTMRMLTGYLPPTSGSIRICGLDVLRESLEVRKRIGYLPEAVPLYREHRVGEMMQFQARLHGMERSAARTRTAEVLERVELSDRVRTPIGKLSKGLRQRVGLAVALLPDPEVLILDEPTSGLDPLQRLAVRELIGELAEDRTVLLSSHILPEVEAMCPRILIIHRGKLIADGRPEDRARLLGGSNHVRLEAMVGPDAEAAVRMLGALPGVREVTDEGRLGIHHVFRVHCDEDLREDVGALAAAKGWALRELSFQQSTLEDLFSRLALGLADDLPESGEAPAPAASTPAPAAAVDASGLTVLGADAPAAQPESKPLPPGQKAEPKVVYNLNPFDMGAKRDLSKPKAIEEEPRTE